MSSVVKEVSIPEQKTFDGVVFPLVLGPADETVTKEQAFSWIKENKEFWSKALLKHGAILFRGFNTPTAEDFDQFVAAFGFENLPYVGGAAPRTNIVGTVFTTNESPPHLFIPFHHEMAQSPSYPSHLFFFCEVPPTTDGQTSICISNLVYRCVLEKYPSFAENIKTKGVRYVRVLSEEDDNESAIGRGWKSTFLTSDKNEAELKMKSLGMTWEWLPDGNLKTVSKVLPGIVEDSRTGIPQWFNSIIAAYTSWEDVRNKVETAVIYGDGTPLEREAVYGTLDIMNEIAVDFPWTPCDMIVIDNRTVMHARRSYTGPRRVLASLAK